jgi:serine/threonine protein kinase
MEQAKNARVIDARTDVWSIGASMFEALAGARPWQGFAAIGERREAQA